MTPRRHQSLAHSRTHEGRRTRQALLASKDYPRGAAHGSRGSERPHCRQGVPVTETNNDSLTWLTQEAYDRLKTELDYLSGPGGLTSPRRSKPPGTRATCARTVVTTPPRRSRERSRAGSSSSPTSCSTPRWVSHRGQTGGRAGNDRDHPVRRRRRRGDLPAGLAEESGAPIDVYSPRSPLGSAINGKKIGDTATYRCGTGGGPRSRSWRPSPTSAADPRPHQRGASCAVMTHTMHRADVA